MLILSSRLPFGELTVYSSCAFIGKVAVRHKAMVKIRCFFIFSIVITNSISLFYWLLQRNGTFGTFEMENSILDMDNFTFAEITILESKIIHIDGKIIYFFFAIYLLILHSANRMQKWIAFIYEGNFVFRIFWRILFINTIKWK